MIKRYRVRKCPKCRLHASIPTGQLRIHKCNCEICPIRRKCDVCGAMYNKYGNEIYWVGKPHGANVPKGATRMIGGKAP